MAYRAPRGTFDVLPADQQYWSFVESCAASVAAAFGYGRIETPIFEDTRLFARGVGSGTDVVQKEMYTFEDRGGDSVTLKAEGTAPVCRAYIEHGMKSLSQPVRTYYLSPIFRYERPQAGRLRQHHQFGVEAIGDGSPQVDGEIIQLGWTYLKRLGLSRLVLKVNSIGDPNCRPAYLEALRAYYAGRVQDLCRDCRRRYQQNPLRLLDCKIDGEKHAADAPRSIDHLCGPCFEHWDELLRILDDLSDIASDFHYEIDPRLVRGLDYYTRTVFEFQPPEEGGQSTILAGGRYDGLIERLGGGPTPGIGFGSGIERVILNLRRQELSVPELRGVDLVAIHVGESARRRTITLAAELRWAGASVVVAPADRGMRSQMRYADSLEARYALILGDRDLERGVATLRQLNGAREQVELPLKPESIMTALDGGMTLEQRFQDQREVWS